MRLNIEQGGIFPRSVYVSQPPIWVQRASLDRRSQVVEKSAQPQNHSSRDRGYQLKVNPVARSKHGNSR